MFGKKTPTPMQSGAPSTYSGMKPATIHQSKSVDPISDKSVRASVNTTHNTGNTLVSEVLFGNELNRYELPSLDGYKAMIRLRGYDGSDNPAEIPFSEGMLGRHIMLIGGIGTGKTNAIDLILAGIRETIEEDSVAIIFDTKGDFYNTFYMPGDIVISNDETAIDEKGRKNYWNIFEEIQTGERMMESIIEISHAIFKEACEKTNQPFFPNAARDIFAAVLWHFMMTKSRKERTNRGLSDFLFSAKALTLKQLLEQYDQFQAMISYIDNESSNQTQGVLAELQQVIRQFFIGNFRKHGTLGLKNLTKKKGGRFIFIEYDLSLGSMLTPIYSLMFDLAIKEAIGRDRSSGNVFFITDEFRLLPHLVHIDDAVNFGRSLGVKFVIGIQNVEQIFENYGEQRARSIMSGFLTTFAFRVTDHCSRQHIKDTFGMNRKKDTYSNIISTKGLSEETRDGYVVEDWDITNQKLGEAIVGLPGIPPFIFRFDYFDEKSYRERLNS